MVGFLLGPEEKLVQWTWGRIIAMLELGEELHSLFKLTDRYKKLFLASQELLAPMLSAQAPAA